MSLILLLVSAGMQSWATLTVSRGIYPNGTEQSYTHKTHGPIQRCVAYELRSKRFLYQDSSLVPQDSCIYLTDINCEKPSYSLASAHVLLETNELLNIDSPVRCNQSEWHATIAQVSQSLMHIASYMSLLPLLLISFCC